jgi:hypothetical protein
MEAEYVSETLVSMYETTQRYSPEEKVVILTAVRTSNLTISVIVFNHPVLILSIYIVYVWKLVSCKNFINAKIHILFSL